MNNFFIDILGGSLPYLVSISAALTALIPLMVKPGQIYNRSFKSYNRIRRVGYILILIFGLGVYFNVLQNIFNDKKSDEQEKQLRESLNRSYKSSLDTMRNNFTNSSREVIGTVVSALAQYKLKLDTTDNRISVVQKAFSKVDVPVLKLLDDDGISIKYINKNTSNIKVIFWSYDEGSTDYQISTYAILFDSTSGFKFIGSPALLQPNIRMPKNTGSYSEVPVSLPPSFSLLYLYVTGTYRNIGTTSRYPIDDVYGYDAINKKFLGVAANQNRSQVLNFLKQNKII